MLYEGLVLFSEIVLSAYPMLIKLVDVSVFFQTGLRMGIFTLLAVTAARASGTPLLTLDRLFSAESLYTGILNLFHVFSSYTAFSALPAGNAMALFYTYPIWNIVGAAAAFGERISWRALPWLALALFGAILLAQPTAGHWALYGVLAALVAALTETGIYLWFRSRAKDDADTSDAPWTGMAQMYGSSGLVWAVAAVVLGGLGTLATNTWRITARSAATITAFNTFVGFLGYALRFYLIPKVSTVAFSAMSFFGVVAAYALDWLFTDTLPTVTQALGAAAIVAANTVLLRKETV